MKEQIRWDLICEVLRCARVYLKNIENGGSGQSRCISDLIKAQRALDKSYQTIEYIKPTSIDTDKPDLENE